MTTILLSCLCALAQFQEVNVPRSFPRIAYRLSNSVDAPNQQFQIIDSFLFVNRPSNAPSEPVFFAINTKTKVVNDPASFDLSTFPVGSSSLGSDVFRVNSLINLKGKAYSIFQRNMRDSVVEHDILNKTSRKVFGVPNNFVSNNFGTGQVIVQIKCFVADDFYFKYIVDTIYSGVTWPFTYPKRTLVVQNILTGERNEVRLKNDTVAFEAQIRFFDNNDFLVVLPHASTNPFANGYTFYSVGHNSGRVDTLNDALATATHNGPAMESNFINRYHNRWYAINPSAPSGNGLYFYDFSNYYYGKDTIGLSATVSPLSAFVHNDSLFISTPTAWWKRHISSRWERVNWPAYGGFWSGWVGGTVWSNGPQGLRYLENGVWKEPINKDPRSGVSIMALNDDQIMVNSSGRIYWSTTAGNAWQEIPATSAWASTSSPITVHPGLILADGGNNILLNRDSLRTLTPQISFTRSMYRGEYKARLINGNLVSVYNDGVGSTQILVGTSTDRGVSWVQRVTTQVPRGTIVRTTAVENVLFVLIDGVGFYRSSDAGVTWSAITTIPPLLNRDYVISGHQQQVLISYDGVPYHSTDAGVTFQRVDPNGWQFTQGMSADAYLNAYGIYHTDASTRRIRYLATPTSPGQLISTPFDIPGVARLAPRARPSGKWLYITDLSRIFRAPANANFTVTSLEGEKSEPLTLYPNPLPSGSRRLYVGKDGFAQLFNLQGAQIFSGQSEDKELTLPSSLNAGVYLLRIGGRSARVVLE